MYIIKKENGAKDFIHYREDLVSSLRANCEIYESKDGVNEHSMLGFISENYLTFLQIKYIDYIHKNYYNSSSKDIENIINLLKEYMQAENEQLESSIITLILSDDFYKKIIIISSSGKCFEAAMLSAVHKTALNYFSKKLLSRFIIPAYSGFLLKTKIMINFQLNYKFGYINNFLIDAVSKKTGVSRREEKRREEKRREELIREADVLLESLKSGEQNFFL